MIDPVLIPIVAIFMIPIIILAKAKAARARHSLSADDARLVQEMNATVMRLQGRVEALETLIIERSPGGVQK